MNPISPAVISNGNKLGIREIIIILKFLNKYAINKDIRKIAKPSDQTKLSTRK